MSVNIEYGPLYCGYFDEDKVDVQNLRFFATLTGAIGHALIGADDIFFERPTINFKLFKLTHQRWQQELILGDAKQGYCFTNCDESFENMVEPVATLSLKASQSILDVRKSTWTLINKPDTMITLIGGVSVTGDEEVYLDFFTNRNGNVALTGVKDKYGENYVDLTVVMSYQLKPSVEMSLYSAIFERLKAEGLPVFYGDGKSTNIVIVDVRQLCLLIYNHGPGSEIVGVISSEIADRILSSILRPAKCVSDIGIDIDAKSARATIAISYTPK